MISNFIKHITYNMIGSFQVIALLVNEYFTPEWQKEVRNITREVVAAMSEVDKNSW